MISARNVLSEFINEHASRGDDQFLLFLHEEACRQQIPAVDLNIGRLLFFLITILRPADILEIGFGSGLSYSYMMKASAFYGGNVLSLENNRFRIDAFSEHAARYKPCYLDSRGKIIHTDALIHLRSMPDAACAFIFIDAMKKEYPEYLAEAARIVSGGGIIAADNLFFSGRTIYLSETPENMHKYRDQTEAMRNFIRQACSLEGFTPLLLTESDGIVLLYKTPCAGSISAAH
ncbi:MAG TPA: hypothetical protein DC049_20385 [Spirochaetia bacterium]|nr:hypothetical protein [Spirochaetia bacterium]